jgi:hypothetical protein
LSELEAVPTNKNRKGVCVRRRKIGEGRLEHDIKQNMFSSFFGATSLPYRVVLLQLPLLRIGCIVVDDTYS